MTGSVTGKVTQSNVAVAKHISCWRMWWKCCCCCDSPAAHLVSSVVQVDEVCNRGCIVP